MTPLELSALIHYHAQSCDWEQGDLPRNDPMFEKFVKDGLLTTSFREAGLDAPRVHQKYYPTERLHAFVRMLCETPLPVQKWVRPEVKHHPMGSLPWMVDLCL